MFDVQGDRNSVKKAKSLKEHTIKTRFDDGKVLGQGTLEPSYYKVGDRFFFSRHLLKFALHTAFLNRPLDGGAQRSRVSNS